MCKKERAARIFEKGRKAEPDTPLRRGGRVGHPRKGRVRGETIKGEIREKEYAKKRSTSLLSVSKGGGTPTFRRHSRKKENQPHKGDHSQRDDRRLCATAATGAPSEPSCKKREKNHTRCRRYQDIKGRCKNSHQNLVRSPGVEVRNAKKDYRQKGAVRQPLRVIIRSWTPV